MGRMYHIQSCNPGCTSSFLGACATDELDHLEGPNHSQNHEHVSVANVDAQAYHGCAPSPPGQLQQLPQSAMTCHCGAVMVAVPEWGNPQVVQDVEPYRSVVTVEVISGRQIGRAHV